MNGKQAKAIMVLGLVAILLVGIMILGTGCDYQAISLEPPTPAMMKVEVYFSGNDTPLIGYIQSLSFESTGMFYQGGSSMISMYDENGNKIAVFNYLRVDSIRLIQQ